MTLATRLRNAEPARRLFVFSHPNHELAVFGLVRRLRPHLVYLTDGGGEHRVQQTRRGLESIGVADRARFLNHTEQSFYEALLQRDLALFEAVAAEVRQSIDEVGAEEVWADAVELYNPVHDVTLPIVSAAVGGRAGVSIVEVPLVYQRPGDGERYECQRVPASYGARRVDVALTADELAAKEHARDEIYGLLVRQMGSVLVQLPREHLAIEQVALADGKLVAPGQDRVLRYEWRGDLLRTRGEVARVITYADHYLPIASSLMDA